MLMQRFQVTAVFSFQVAALIPFPQIAANAASVAVGSVVAQGVRWCFCAIMLLCLNFMRLDEYLHPSHKMQQPRHFWRAEWRAAGVVDRVGSSSATAAGCALRVSDECIHEVPTLSPLLSRHSWRVVTPVCCFLIVFVFCRCMQTNNDNFQACSFYFDMVKQCKASAGQK
jgi:hypothetical protein